MRAMTDYSPCAAEVQANPYPSYDWLRREHPVYDNARLDFWALSRYVDVVLAARTPEVFSSAQGVGPDKRPGLTMIAHDPPVHTRLRQLVTRALTPRLVEQCAPRIQAIVDARLDAVMVRGACDLVADLALPLPVIVMATMLGGEPEHREDLKRWSDEMVHCTAGTAHGADRARYQQSWEEFRAYFSWVIEARRQSPRDDLITLMVQAQEERDALTTMDILNGCDTPLRLKPCGFLGCPKLQSSSEERLAGVPASKRTPLTAWRSGSRSTMLRSYDVQSFTSQTS